MSKEKASLPCRVWKNEEQSLPVEINYTFNLLEVVNYVKGGRSLYMRDLDYFSVKPTTWAKQLKKIDVFTKDFVISAINSWQKIGSEEGLFTLKHTNKLGNEGGIVIASCGNYDEMHRRAFATSVYKGGHAENGCLDLILSVICLPNNYQTALDYNGKGYIQHIITHEFGHALGLQHFLRRKENEDLTQNQEVKKLLDMGLEGCTKTIMEYPSNVCAPFMACSQQDDHCRDKFFNTEPGELDREELIRNYKFGVAFWGNKNPKEQQVFKSELGPQGENKTLSVENISVKLEKTLYKMASVMGSSFFNAALCTAVPTFLTHFLKNQGLSEERVKQVGFLLNALLIFYTGTYGATLASISMRLMLKKCFFFSEETDLFLGNAISAVVNNYEATLSPLGALKTFTSVSFSCLGSIMGSKAGFWVAQKCSDYFELTTDSQEADFLKKSV